MKTTKRAIQLCALMIIIIMAAVSVIASYEQSGSVAIKNTIGRPNLQILMTRYDPFPVEPGEYVDVWLKIGNEEDADIEDFTFEILEEFPFSLDSSETAVRYFGKINANSIQTMHFKVRVSPDAIEGSNKLKFRYRYVDSDSKWIPGEISIQVQTREAILGIKSVMTSGEYLIPGKEAIVAIELTNMAQSVIRDIAVRLDLTMSTIASNPRTLAPGTAVIDSYYNALPFVPMNSVTEKRIAKLDPGESAIFEYTIRTFADAESKTYKVPLIVTFKDELSKNFTKADILGLVVGAEPDIAVTINDDTVYGKGKGTVQFRIVNKGVNDVKFLTVFMESNGDFEVMSAKQIYIGDVDSDDYETADFSLLVKDVEDKKLSLPIKLEFKDANNKEFSEEYTIELTAYTQKERGMGGSNGIWTIIILLVVMAGGYLIYKRWEKKKKSKK